MRKRERTGQKLKDTEKNLLLLTGEVVVEGLPNTTELGLHVSNDVGSFPELSQEAEIQTIGSLNDIEIVYADDPEEQNVEDNFVEEEEISNEISSPHKSKGATPILSK